MYIFQFSFQKVSVLAKNDVFFSKKATKSKFDPHIRLKYRKNPPKTASAMYFFKISPQKVSFTSEKHTTPIAVADNPQ